MLRSILHCDMNNFYASVECMLDPALKKYPIAVCGSVEERHGIVLAKNYKAKAFDDVANVFTKDGGSLMELFNVIQSHIHSLQTMEEIEMEDRINKEYKINKEMDW